MAFDLTADTVNVALVTKGADPTDTDWVAASWVTNAPTLPAPSIGHLSTEFRYFKVAGTVVDDVTGATESDTAYARVLIGPAAGGFFAQAVAVTLDAYVQIGDSPEVVVKKAGTQQFT